MRFHYDLAQASPVLRDSPIYDATSMIAGQAVGLSAVTESGCLWDTTTASVDVAGVLAETPSSSITDVVTGTEYFAKVIVNPLGVFLAEWDWSTSQANTVASSTGETVTVSAVDAEQEGGWVYCPGPSGNVGEGNLYKIGSDVNGTVALTNATGAAYDDELKANDTSTAFILIRRTWGGDPTGGAIALDSTFAKLSGDDETAGAIILLENYVNHSRFPMEPLRVAKHGGKNVKNAQFYGDIYFTDHALRVATTY